MVKHKKVSCRILFLPQCISYSPITDWKTFLALTGTLRTWTFLSAVAERQRCRSVHTPEMKDRILNDVTGHPGINMCSNAAAEHIVHLPTRSSMSRSCILNICSECKAYTHKITLKGSNFVGSCSYVPEIFQPLMLCTDEAKFTCDGIMNFYNQYLWAYNSWSICSDEQFSVYTWEWIIWDALAGPYVYQQKLTGAFYHDTLCSTLLWLLEDVSLQTRACMWFIYNEVPPHFSITVRTLLHKKYPEWWVGWGGSTAWPTRSPHSNPMVSHLWGHLKRAVYLSISQLGI
jgi:hypothetical protein